MDTNQKELKNTHPSENLQLVKLVNKNNTELVILNFGATIFSLKINGINVIVGPEKPETYLADIYHTRGKFFGASVGRYAGRISKGGFEIEGVKYAIFEKDGVHIHGGEYGFSYKFWEVGEMRATEDPYVILEYVSPHLEEGYPGELRVQVKYTLTEADEVKIEYTAKTDRKTVINLTNHAYINLNGGGDIDDHKLQIRAEKYLETDAQKVPTGNLLNTAGTEFDFRKAAAIGEVPLDTVFSLKNGEKQVVLVGDQSGISMEITTNQPAVVVYVPEELPTDWKYTFDIASERAAICLETQNFPDAPHQPDFPSAILEPGQIYINTTLWKFKTGS